MYDTLRRTGGLAHLTQKFYSRRRRMICKAPFSPTGKDFQILKFSYQEFGDGKGEFSFPAHLISFSQHQNSLFPIRKTNFVDLQHPRFPPAVFKFFSVAFPFPTLKIPFLLPQNSLFLPTELPMHKFSFPTSRIPFFPHAESPFFPPSLS
jgi:hypothetical protein